MEKKQKHPLKIILNVVISFFIILIIVFIIFALAARTNQGIPKIFGKSYLTVLSDSMDIENVEYDFDGFKRGDIIVIDRYSWDQASEIVFNVGDIITFEWVDNNGNLFYLTHRIIEVNNDNSYYITQGDVAASLGQSTDPANGHVERVYFVEVVGLYEKTIPWVGNIFLFIQSPLGFLLVIILPLVAILIYEIFNFRKIYINYRKEMKGKNKTSEDLEKEIEKLQRQIQEKKK